MRLRTLVLIRWIAIAGQTTAILVVRYGFGYPFDIFLASAVVGASAILNGVLTVRHPPTKRLSDREVSLQLAYDLVQLAILLFLTGGLANPFAVLVLVPVTISATNLSGRSTMWLALLATAAITLLALYHEPLPWIGEFRLAPVYVFGIWFALVIGTLFMSVYAWRVAREARHMADALAATQLALAREQRLSALGGLAAAAAHELGTPLSTIAIAARELSRGEVPDDGFASDVELIRSQALRCREILARLAHEAPHSEHSPYDRLPFAALVDEAARPHAGFGIKIETAVRAAPEQTEPFVVRSPEIIHGLGNLIENAVGYARKTVEIVVSWDSERISVGVYDDGPGFEAGVLGSLGEPYVSSRAPEAVTGDSEEDGLGLGVFIAKTLLEHTGAGINFGYTPQGGAAVDISWLRAALDAGPPQSAKTRAGEP